MTPDPELRQTLRDRVGESVNVPAGETADDTLFSDDEINRVLLGAESMAQALLEAWVRKAAKLAHLVDTTEGQSVRRLSQAHTNAMAEVKLHRELVDNPDGEVRPSTSQIHRIANPRRRNRPWTYPQ